MDKKDFDQFEKLFDGIQANKNSMQSDAKDDYNKLIADLGIGKSVKGNNLQKEIYDIFRKGNETK